MKTSVNLIEHTVPETAYQQHVAITFYFYYFFLNPKVKCSVVVRYL